MASVEPGRDGKSPDGQARKRVLLVASTYQPALSASMHRVRMMAWHLGELGWDFEILAPSLRLQKPSWSDPDGARFFAPGVRVTEVEPVFGHCLLSALGIRDAGWQALLPMYKAGEALLKRKRFDLVFISTTAFNFFCLGRLWLDRLGVPYILDFQDPWFREEKGLKTTRHVWKAWAGNHLSRHMESFAVHKAKGLVAVSPDYLDLLKQRYPEARPFQDGNCITEPFGARAEDFHDIAARENKQKRVFTVAYVGAGGVVMEKSFRRLAAGLGRLRKRHPALLAPIRIHLHGTDGGWREGERKLLQHQADLAGIGDLVEEDPRPVPYSQATAIASAADGLLVLGVDERAYMASKLFPYAQLGKPLLACLHAASQMNGYFEKYPELGIAIHFGAGEEREREEDVRILDFLTQVTAGARIDRTRLAAEHSSLAMTRKIAALFTTCSGPPA